MISTAVIQVNEETHFSLCHLLPLGYTHKDVHPHMYFFFLLKMKIRLRHRIKKAVFFKIFRRPKHYENNLGRGHKTENRDLENMATGQTQTIWRHSSETGTGRARTTGMCLVTEVCGTEFPAATNRVYFR